MKQYKYIDPTTWELVTAIDGVEVNRTNDLSRVLQHIKRGCV